MDYQKQNEKIIAGWIEDGWKWGTPITHEAYERAKAGEWEMLLTPTKVVPREWFGDLKGKKVLGLASGGGMQMPVFNACGAECTVFDYSEKQLESDRMVAEREGYEIRTVQGDQTKPLPFLDEEFDIVFNSVSDCFVEEIRSTWKECYRILKKGGIFVSGCDHFVDYIVDDAQERIVYPLPFNPLKDEKLMQELLDENVGIVFSHSLEEIIGGQLEAGFHITNFYEDTSGKGRLHEMNIPTHVVMRCVKD